MCVQFLVLVLLCGTVLQEQELLKYVCTVLNACTIVRYSTAGVRMLKYVCTVLNACSIVRYSTAGVRIVKMCVQFLMFVLLCGTVLQE